MKPLKLAVLAACFITTNLFAQSPKAVEADISASFKKIAHWNAYRFEHSGTDTAVSAIDSVEKVNKAFREKLQLYTTKYPFTLKLRFKDLDSSMLTILTSKDRLFRIYSWDNDLGGTMRYYENVFQYKAGAKVSSELKADTSEGNGDYHYDYSRLYTLKANGHTYYLAIFHGKFSTKDLTQGIQLFSIDKGKLTDSVNIIKTDGGLHSKLSYYFNIFSVTDKIKNENIKYNEALKTISLPVVLAHGRLTNWRITYKFNGKYFERVKSR